MPELPEVETIRRGVEGSLVGKRVADVEVLVPKILKPPFTDPEEFAEKLISSRMVNARRRGKHLIFGMDSGYALYAHLNMRGQLVVAQDSAAAPSKYLCLVIGFETATELRYHDIWTWGELRLVPDRPEDIASFVPALGSMGPEPLSETFTGEGLKYGARSKQGTAIKTVLLDQSVVAGVGNIYGDEALFRSGISPLRKAGSLTDAEWRILAENIKMVIGDAVSAGGTLSNNYVDVYGLVGRYRPQVYGRANEPCIDCGVQLKGSRLAGRSTVFCPNCQQ